MLSSRAWKSWKVLGWCCGDFLGFIASRVCKAFGKKRLVFEKHTAKYNTQVE
jgi:hypothetical protein